MRCKNLTHIAIALSFVILGGCGWLRPDPSLPPAPCDCRQAIDDLVLQAELYHQALKDKGLLRESLKACERRMEGR